MDWYTCRGADSTIIKQNLASFIFSTCSVMTRQDIYLQKASLVDNKVYLWWADKFVFVQIVFLYNKDCLLLFIQKHLIVFCIIFQFLNCINAFICNPIEECDTQLIKTLKNYMIICLLYDYLKCKYDILFYSKYMYMKYIKCILL